MKYTLEKSRCQIEQTVRNGIIFTILDGELLVAAYAEEVPQLFGMDEPQYIEAIKKDALAGVFELDKNTVRESLMGVLSQKSEGDFYFRVSCPDEGGRWIHAYGSLLQAFGGEPLITAELYRIDEEARCYHTFLDNDPDILYVCEVKTWQMLFANKTAVEHWGRSDYIGRTCYEFIKGKAAPCDDCPLWKLKNGRAHLDDRYDEYLKCWVRGDCHAAEWYGRNAFYHRLCDISETHEVQRQLDMKGLLLRRIAETIYEFIGVINVASKRIRFIDVNSQVENAVTYSPASYDAGSLEAINRFVVPEERAHCRRCCSLDNIVTQLSINDTYSYTWSQPTRNGPDSRKQITFCWLDNSHKEIVALKSDVTDAHRHETEQMSELLEAMRRADAAKRAELEMTYRAENDSMTGVLNRESIRKRIDSLLADSNGGPFAFLMIDLDNFKLVNDTYGHGEGDRVIIEAAEAFKDCAAKHCLVGRLGGDEFCVFCPSVPSKLQLCLMAEKICRSINEIPLCPQETAFASCSIGVAYCEGKTCFEQIYRIADKALYVRKKKEGRNGYTFCEM